MSSMLKHVFNPKNDSNISYEGQVIEDRSRQKQLSKTIYTDTLRAKRCAKNLKKCNNNKYIGHIGSKRHQIQANGQVETRKIDFYENGEDSEYNNLINYAGPTKSANYSKKTWHSLKRKSSTETVGGLSASSILELYDTSLRSDSGKLRKLQEELRRNYNSCCLKHELVTIAALCSTRTENLLKPCPKIFMVNNETCFDEMKFVLNNVKSLKYVLNSRNATFLDNRIFLDILHWTFFESKLPTFIEVQFDEIINELHGIDVLRLPVRPSLVTRVKYAHSNQELDYRHCPKYLKQNEDYDIKEGFVAVPLQLLYQVLVNGMEVLIKDKRGVPIYFNFIASIESIQDNFYLLSTNYSSTLKFIFEYFAILITELILPRDYSVSSKDDMRVFYKADCVYYMKNVKRIKTKFIFFFKMGSSRALRKLISIEQIMQDRILEDFTQDSPIQNDSKRTKESPETEISLSITVHSLSICLTVICFIWYMKTCRYF